MLGDWRHSGSRRGGADLAAAIELHVLDGRLPVGTRLPAERELADALGVSRTLVGAALDRLREGGLVASRQGAGSWITFPRGGSGLQVHAGERLDLIDLAHASPSAVPALLPALDSARGLFTAELLDHGYGVRGLAVLRERVAARYTARGLPTEPGQVLITNGAQHAFALVLRTLAGPGDRVLVEQPCYPNTPEAIRAAHTLPVPVAVDPRDGWDVPGIEAALRQAAPRLAYFCVDFQNPTGHLLDAEDRERLGAALARARTPAVVDETMAELDLRDDASPVPPLAAFAGEWAITVGSASKSFWGGLRLGWIRAQEDVLDRLVAARWSLDLGSPVLEQLVLAELLADPDPVLRGRRAEVRERRDAVVAALGEHCPEWRFRVPEGGLSLWCGLPEPMSTRLSVAAANHGVQVAQGSRFGVHGGLERWLRLPFSLPPERLTEAVRRLGVAAASVVSTAPVLESPAGAVT
ncbi:PLP-dependent aminotransferase family protein [Prauserella sp. ASG 168]|uniref:PLP-dependent aminotransferase family protein n=2 Tax=Prauserella cavernicola TaxID=2800127 RepID=A0A934V4M4_9PSEU|nr:PLP-dependent aminotransferase family protein [Prauserella cavernicola]